MTVIEQLQKDLVAHQQLLKAHELDKQSLTIQQQKLPEKWEAEKKTVEGNLAYNAAKWQNTKAKITEIEDALTKLQAE